MKNKRTSWNKGMYGVCLNTGRTHFKKGHKPKDFKGYYTSTQGYVLVLKKDHPFCSCRGYVPRCRLVMENKLGRFLYKEESVHHINGIRDDDNEKNLIVFASKAEHIRQHMIGNKINLGRTPWNKKPQLQVPH